MAPMKVLINGASIAGPAVAHWLLRGLDEVEITIVERAAEFRVNGQSVDIRNSGIEVMQKMGIESAVRSKMTDEKGLTFVNSKGEDRVVMPTTVGSTSKQSFTSEFEIFRGDLAKIVQDTIEDRVTTVCGEYVTMMKNQEHGVYVEFANGKAPETYDIVIGADGLGSKTRAMAFNTTTREHIRSLYTYIAYFTIEEDLLQGSKIAKWYNATGGRFILMRPDPRGVNRANIGVVFAKTPAGKAQLDELVAAEKQGLEALKAKMASIMTGAGWVSEKVVQGIHDADDFYSSEIGQIRNEELATGRVVLVGDSAYCPGTMTGMGTTLAMIGAYILAGEICKNPSNPQAALKSYESLMLPIARKAQILPPGQPHYMNPQSQWAINLRNFVGWFLMTFKFDSVFNSIFMALSGDKHELPEYTWKDLKQSK